MATVHLIRSKSRRFRCDLAGCRNFTNILVTKRGDVSARPIHLCEDCIKGIYSILTAEEPKDAPKEAEIVEAEIVEEEVPHIKPPEKSEAKPNKARKNPKK